jgi:hypothetical protein
VLLVELGAESHDLAPHGVHLGFISLDVDMGLSELITLTLVLRNGLMVSVFFTWSEKKGGRLSLLGVYLLSESPTWTLWTRVPGA